MTSASIAGAYLVTGAGLLLALVTPVWGILCFGAGTAAYYQLTRALVVAGAEPGRRGRAAGQLTAVSRLAGVPGAGVCLVAATLVAVSRWRGAES